MHVLPASLHRPREELMKICITGGAAVPKAALDSTEFVIRNEKLRRLCRIKRLRANVPDAYRVWNIGIRSRLSRAQEQNRNFFKKRTNLTEIFIFFQLISTLPFSKSPFIRLPEQLRIELNNPPNICGYTKIRRLQ